MLKGFRTGLVGLVMVATCLTVAGTPAQASVECGTGRSVPTTLASSLTYHYNGTTLNVYLDARIESVTHAYCGTINAYVAYAHGSTPVTADLLAELSYGPTTQLGWIDYVEKTTSGTNGLYFDAPVGGQAAACGRASVTGTLDGYQIPLGYLVTATVCP